MYSDSLKYHAFKKWATFQQPLFLNCFCKNHVSEWYYLESFLEHWFQVIKRKMFSLSWNNFKCEKWRMAKMKCAKLCNWFPVSMSLPAISRSERSHGEGTRTHSSIPTWQSQGQWSQHAALHGLVKELAQLSNITADGFFPLLNFLLDMREYQCDIF